jgi:threonine dehydrogenase-like Zn-dependent dehydrogenase
LKAVALSTDNHVQRVERDSPARSGGEVLVRVSQRGLCGSDKRLIRKGAGHIRGHELVGAADDYSPGIDGSDSADGSVVICFPCGTYEQYGPGYSNRCTTTFGLVGWGLPCLWLASSRRPLGGPEAAHLGWLLGALGVLDGSALAMEAGR